MNALKSTRLMGRSPPPPHCLPAVGFWQCVGPQREKTYKTCVCAASPKKPPCLGWRRTRTRGARPRVVVRARADTGHTCKAPYARCQRGRTPRRGGTDPPAARAAPARVGVAYRTRALRSFSAVRAGVRDDGRSDVRVRDDGADYVPFGHISREPDSSMRI